MSSAASKMPLNIHNILLNVQYEKVHSIILGSKTETSFQPMMYLNLSVGVGEDY